MANNQNLEEQLISQAAERQVSDQLDAVEEIDIFVQTNLLKIVQGQADGVTVSGQGLVTKDNIRVQEIKLETDSIDINPISAIFGQIELNKPVNFVARVTLNEADLNHALNSPISRKFVQKFQLNVEGKTVNFDLEEMQLSLTENGQIRTRGKLQLKANGHQRLLGFTSIIRPRTRSHPIMLESFNCTQGGGLSTEFILSLMQKMEELANLPYLEMDNIKLRIQNIEVQKETLILLVRANLPDIPDKIAEAS